MYTLRPYQSEAVEEAVAFLKSSARRNAIEVLPTGSGKSLIIANIVARLGAPALVFQPSKEILEQNLSKLQSYGYCGAVYSASKGRTEVADITFATIGSVVNKSDLFTKFPYVIVDECFIEGTKIDGRNIEDVRPGDAITTFDLSKMEIVIERVKAVSKRPSPRCLIRINFGDRSVVSTPNHPFYFVGFGYVEANDLRIGDRLYVEENTTGNNAMLGMREAADIQELSPLLEGAEDGAGLPQGVHAQTGGAGVFDPNEIEQSDVESGSARKDVAHPPENRPQAHGPRREWPGYVGTGRDIAEVPGGRLEVRAGGSDETLTKGGVPVPLQDRYSEPGPEDSRGGGRKFALLQEGAGPEEGVCIRSTRVESVEVLEQRGDGTYADGKRHDYVYNLEVEGRNSNYFANGVLVHNCHLVNAKEGMYKTFLGELEKTGAKVLGLTATPYRLANNSFGSELRFLTRTRPKVFHEMIYFVQNRELFDSGYLARMEYATGNGFDRDRLQVNSTGADYTDESVRRYYRSLNFQDKIVMAIEREMETRKNALVFTRFVEESEYLVRCIPGAEIVTGETKKKERERLIEGFKAGDIPVICNVGVLTTGFDYPELETVILARPTMSLGLYYQMIGRSIRPHPKKEHARVVDLCGNYKAFGRIEDLEIVDGGNGKWFVAANGRQLTNVYNPRG